jgi:hypothetical protein
VFLKAELEKIDYQSAGINVGVWANVKDIQELDRRGPENGRKLVMHSIRKGGK